MLNNSISFPVVAGGCYNDDPSNIQNYTNCSDCYETLANGLMNTDDNKYRLGRTFFPYNATKPVQVKVVYVSQDYNPNKTSDDKCRKFDKDNETSKSIIWYWLLGEFYVYQPLEVFLYRSLYFSPPWWRQKCVFLRLPPVCLKNPNHDHFAYLTNE